MKLLGRIKLLELDKNRATHTLLVLNVGRQHFALLQGIEATVGKSLTGFIDFKMVAIGAMHNVSSWTY